MQQWVAVGLLAWIVWLGIGADRLTWTPIGHYATLEGCVTDVHTWGAGFTNLLQTSLTSITRQPGQAGEIIAFATEHGAFGTAAAWCLREHLTPTQELLRAR
jgi:hypothetical protein